MQADEDAAARPAAGAAPADPEADQAAQPATAPDETALLRDLVTRAYPDVVPELVHGASLAELLASIPAAQAAYARVAAVSRAGQTAPVTVPAGAAVRTPAANVEALSPLAKIRAGLDG